MGQSPASDRILIYDLLARCILGVGEEERREKQDVVINIALDADLRPAAKSDRFEDAVDYRAINKRLLALVEGSSFHLVESLAEAVAAACLETRCVVRAVVRVEKPGALRFARSVGVEIVRARHDSEYTRGPGRPAARQAPPDRAGTRREQDA